VSSIQRQFLSEEQVCDNTYCPALLFLNINSNELSLTEYQQQLGRES